MINCPICFTIREQIINTEDTIVTLNENIAYYEERLNYLHFTSVNRLAFRPHYQALDVFRQLLLFQTSLLTSLETCYDRHLTYHNI